jgi:hypothetical protein
MDNDFIQNRIIQDVVLNPDNDKIGVVIFTQGYSPESNDITVTIHKLIKKNAVVTHHTISWRNSTLVITNWRLNLSPKYQR